MPHPCTYCNDAEFSRADELGVHYQKCAAFIARWSQLQPADDPVQAASGPIQRAVAVAVAAAAASASASTSAPAQTAAQTQQDDGDQNVGLESLEDGIDA
jgi:hypothetical protein